jgi:glycerate 2-kinase
VIREHERRVAHAEAILRAAVAAADPAPAVVAALQNAAGDLDNARRVHVIAIGKAASRMGAAALTVLPRPPESCLIVAPQGGPRHGFIDCRLLTGAHPVPDASSVRAGSAVAALLSAAADGDVVLVLLSGGASSVCALPAEGVSLEAYARIVAALLRSGTDIHDLNCVRRRIDTLKGGGMAARAAPARVLGLIVSDVPYDDPAVIASGPISPDPASADDALRILRDHDLLDETLERAILRRETVPAEVFDGVSARIVLDNGAARRGAGVRARSLGYEVIDTAAPVTGEAREEGARLGRQIARLDAEAGRATCMIAGGETTVRVTGDGQGGRNQELVLAAALALPENGRAVIGSVGTDGVDGPTNAAGAVSDADVVTRAVASGLDPRSFLEWNDSFAFFRRMGGHVITGPTGTNVMDVMVGLAGPYV